MTHTPIQEFARLDLILDRLRASGQPVPEELANRYQSFVARATVGLTPEQRAAAMRYVRQEQANLLAAERQDLDSLRETRQALHEARSATQSRLAAALRNAGARRISETARLGRDGKQLDEQQIGDALKHGKYQQAGRVHHTDQTVARTSRVLGRDVSADEVGKQMGRFADLMGNPRAMSKYLDEQVGPDDEVARAELEQSIRETWLSYTLRKRHDDELRQRDPDAFKPKVIKMTDDERRRLDVADATIAHAGPQFFVETINDRGERDADGNALDRRAALVDAFEAAGDEQDPEVVEALNDRDDIERIASDNGLE